MRQWYTADRTFDMVVSGQAWHWVNMDVGPPNAASVLRPRGKLAAFWNRGTLDAEAKLLIDEAYLRYVPALAAGYAPLTNFQEGKSEDIAAIVATGSFDAPENRLYELSQRYSG